VELEVDPDFCPGTSCQERLSSWLALFQPGDTLLALALVIGIIVVDDAIVDVENITRHTGNLPAAISATSEIGLIYSRNVDNRGGFSLWL